MFFTFTTATCKKTKESRYESEFNTWCDGEADDELQRSIQLLSASRQQEKSRLWMHKDPLSDHTNTDAQNNNHTDVNKQFRR